MMTYNRPFSKRRLRLWFRLRLACPRRLFWQLREFCVCALSASDERTKPQTESRSEAVDLKSSECLHLGEDNGFTRSFCCHLEFKKPPLTGCRWDNLDRLPHNALCPVPAWYTSFGDFQRPVFSRPEVFVFVACLKKKSASRRLIKYFKFEWEIISFSKTTLLQTEPALTMFHTTFPHCSLPCKFLC